MKRTVKIGDLRDQLSAHLRRVRRGEEVIVMDRDRPVARIVPFAAAELDQEAELLELAREGRVRLPIEAMDWKAFDRMKSPRLRGNELLDALIADRDGR